MKRKVLLRGWMRIMGQGWKKVMDVYHDNQDEFYMQELRKLKNKEQETTDTPISICLHPADETPTFGGILNGLK